MADEWWSSARTDGASAGLTAPAAAAESATSTASTDFRTSLHDAAATSPSFLADPHMDWTQACMGGRAAAEATTSFNALLQLQGEASRNLLLDQPPPPPVPAQYDGEGLLYADNQYSSSVMSYGNMPASATMNPFPQQQFSDFPFGTSGFVGASNMAATEITKPPQALEPQNLKSNTEGVQDACSSVTRKSAPNSPAAVKKKPRIETPSPLPTFKVRKEKLGDRITALQQLVSPFGKTDTASVLHDAIAYIKFLHDQVASLSSPYLRCGRPTEQQQQQGSGKAKVGSETKEDLRSRGLCLIPVASTYSVANETTPEFWHPTFGGTFR